MPDAARFGVVPGSAPAGEVGVALAGPSVHRPDSRPTRESTNSAQPRGTVATHTGNDLRQAEKERVTQLVVRDSTAALRQDG
ncbi:hypothetical protein [Streptomyces sp. NPDC127066]|uniref:hypothetical protein n=1 Tax=Streptomyces sp. NPDC127066 TaxID=3347125 RepID=UPI003649052E